MNNKIKRPVGHPPKYSEPTVTVSVKVPKSKKQEIKAKITELLLTYQI